MAQHQFLLICSDTALGQVECPLSEMLGTRSITDFRVGRILKCFPRLHWLNLPNLKSEKMLQSPKLSGYDVSAQRVLGSGGFTNRDAQLVSAHRNAVS